MTHVFLGLSKSTALILNKLVSHTKDSIKYDIVWFPDIFQSHFCVIAKTVQKKKITKRTVIFKKKKRNKDKEEKSDTHGITN